MSDALVRAIKSVKASIRDEFADGVLTIGGERALTAEIEHLRKQIDELIGGLIDQTVRADETEAQAATLRDEIRGGHCIRFDGQSRCEALRGALSLVDLALSQHSEGPAVAGMRIAGNGPTIGEIVRRALANNNAALRIAPGSEGDGAPLKVPQGANGQAISDSREESGTGSNPEAAPNGAKEAA